MAWVTLAVTAASTLYGADQADKKNTQAENARKNAMNQFAGIDVPTVDSQTLALQNYQNAGELTPEMQQQIALGNTNMDSISTDPRLQAAQMQALQQISGLASGRPQAGDMAGFELARQNVAGEQQAQQGKILQDMQQRGQAGSGAELLAKLKGNQVGAQTLANQQLEQAKAMQAARMQALNQQATMSTQIRGQDYNEQSNLANARDQIAKYNAANAQNVSNTNVGAKNLANAQNLQNKQNLSNQNTETQNNQQKYNKNLLQTQFQNKIQKAGGVAAQLNNQANADQQAGANTAAGWAQFGQGAGQTINSAMQKSATSDATTSALDAMSKKARTT